ncbi:MAG: diphosphomevalonate decarboxylase [Polyangiaceae bacterium]|nr:diphosphomevalonate decarboxylase [Polyangiaceae bacterium]
MKKARAVAHANIALAKYWGKSDVVLNLPAVPSISLTLDGLRTETEVEFDGALAEDALELDGRPASVKELARAVELLGRIRARAAIETRARVRTVNHFPTAAGLASSASGFAALAAAGSAAAGLDLTAAELSRMARQSSASAARSIFGGFAELPAGLPGDAELAALPLFGREHWDVRIVVAVAAKGPKKVGSTEGMERSRLTSPFYQAWVDGAPRIAADIRAALGARDLDALGRAMEQSTLAFHACAMASAPGILYFQPATLSALATVHRLRDEGVSVYATMDAGPHVKALCGAADAEVVRRALAETAGVLDTHITQPGPGVEVSA